MNKLKNPPNPIGKKNEGIKLIPPYPYPPPRPYPPTKGGATSEGDE